MYPQIPTAFSSDKLYDFVFCVWTWPQASALDPPSLGMGFLPWGDCLDHIEII